MLSIGSEKTEMGQVACLPLVVSKTKGSAIWKTGLSKNCCKLVKPSTLLILWLR